MTGTGELLELIAKLRGEGGCPWDKKQTLATLAPFLLEEAQEAVAEIEKGDFDGMCEELGDVMLIVTMICQVAGEQGAFTFDDAVRTVCEKIVRRHPHVFGTTVVNSTEEILDNWNKIKLEEKRAKGKL